MSPDLNSVGTCQTQYSLGFPRRCSCGLCRIVANFSWHNGGSEFHNGIVLEFPFSMSGYCKQIQRSAKISRSSKNRKVKIDSTSLFVHLHIDTIKVSYFLSETCHYIWLGQLLSFFLILSGFMIVLFHFYFHIFFYYSFFSLKLLFVFTKFRLLLNSNFH